MITIKKRNGMEVPFDKEKIKNAVWKANTGLEPHAIISKGRITLIADEIEEEITNMSEIVSVEDIQDMVIRKILEFGYYVVATNYIKYRYGRELLRNEDAFNKLLGTNLELLENSNEEAKTENSNKNTAILSTQRDYMAGGNSKIICEKVIYPEWLWDLHKRGIIHIHDTDYKAQRMFNCSLINAEDMLQNGTRISGVPIYKPHSFRTACTVLTQIVAQVASSQYGGQTFTLSHLAPFVEVSRQNIRKDVINELSKGIDNGEISIKVGSDAYDNYINRVVEQRVADEIRKGVQIIQYQLITLQTTNGQAPFVSMFMYIDEVPEGQTRDDLVLIIKEVLRQRIDGIDDGKGHKITPAFPKLLFVLDEDNVPVGSKYHDVFKLAVLCSSKRMYPDYISAKKMKELKNGNVYPCMGCRSFLTVEDSLKNEDGTNKFYGRFNQGVVSINLPHIALSSGGDMNKFWQIFEDRLEACHKALRIAHERLLGTTSDVAPILWQDGAIARLEPGEKIDKLLYGNYSTISLGYAGLYECTMYMTGHSHTGEGKSFAKAVMQKMNDKCAEWKAAENIGYSVYGTPLESTTGKFAKALKEFPEVKEVNDHLYVTNSYHVSVREKIDAFNKLSFESEFQELSPGGAISYIEISSILKNLEAAEAVVAFMYDNIMYAEMNTKLDICFNCGFEGEVELNELDKKGHFEWKCPCCGNTDKSKLSVTRRTCGYLGQNWWSAPRESDIHDRILHLG